MNIKVFIKQNVSKIIKFFYKITCKYINVDNKTILFVAYHGRGYLCNPKYIHKYMINDKRFSEYKFVWALKDNKIKIDGAVVIKYGRIKYLYYLSKSKYWIVNCKLPKYVVKKKNQIYIQTWHGTPLKRLAHDINIGNDAVFYRSCMNREQMLETYDYDSRKYNYFISPNKFSTKKFISAFRISKDKIIETGYPRNDYLTDITKEQINELKYKYNIPINKKIILYAPTWRDNSYNSKGYTFKLKTNFKLWKEHLGQDYVVIFKPHYLIVNNYTDYNLEGFLYNIKENEDINDLYAISDILITDYSSVFFDYAILKRPILFYMYDLEDYRDNLRGFYLDINKDLPGEIITNEIKLLEKIKDIMENGYNEDDLIKFNKKFNYLHSGKSARKISDKIISNEKEF